MHRVLTPADYRSTSWKDGGGRTTEIVSYPHGAGLDRFIWRASVADVERNGPFSGFPGVDRTLVLLQGAGLILSGVGEPLEVRAHFEPVKFAWLTIPVADKPRDEQVRIQTELSPIYHVSKNTAPTFIITGDTDALVPHEQSMRFIAKLQEKGVPCKIDIRPGLGRGWPTINKDYSLIADWFDEQLAAKPEKK